MAKDAAENLEALREVCRDLVDDADTAITAANALEIAVSAITRLKSELGRAGDAVAASLGGERASLIFSRAREQAKAALSDEEIEAAAAEAYGK